MTEAERNERRILQAKKARRKHRLLVGSSWSLVLTAFTGFFVLWNHLGATPTQAAVSQTGTASSSTAAPTQTQPRHHHHHDDFGDGSGSSQASSASSSSGSATVIPSQGSDFSSSAS